MLLDYAPILVLMGMVATFAVASLILSDVLGRKRRSLGKGWSYECGMETEGDARIRISIHFYLVAVSFIVFDVESLFLIPWAAAARGFAAAGVGVPAFLLVGAFLLVLVLGLVFEWRAGGLEWDR